METKKEYKNIFSFNRKFDFRNIVTFVTLLILPNILGMINLSTKMGFKIHFFQLAIFIAAMLYGPFGGLFSGATGSLYSAIIMHNPYIVLFNMILGFFFGLFVRKNVNVLLSVWAAFLIEIPILLTIDHYIVGLSLDFLKFLLISLFISDTIWAIFAKYFSNGLKKILLD